MDPENNGRTWLLTARCDEPDATPEDAVEALTQYILLHQRLQEAANNQAPKEKNSCVSYVVDLWASCPAPIPLRPPSATGGNYYYENLILSNDNSDSCDDQSWCQKATETMREWGVLMQPGILADGAVADLKVLVDEAIDQTHIALAVHRPEIAVGRADFCFREIASRGRERFDLRLNDDPRILSLLEQRVLEANPRMRAFLETILGSLLVEIDYDVSVVYSRPGAENASWHADGDHQKGAMDAGWQADGWRKKLANPYAVCLFIPLIDLDDETGFTQFWPGSHRNKELYGFGPVAQLAEATFDGKCSAGDAVFYDYRLFHRGMANRSRDTIRPVIQIIFKKKWYVEKANYGVDSISTEDKKKVAMMNQT